MSDSRVEQVEHVEGRGLGFVGEAGFRGGGEFVVVAEETGKIHTVPFWGKG